MEPPGPAAECPGSTGRVSSWGPGLAAPSLPFQDVAASCGLHGMIAFLDCLKCPVSGGSLVAGWSMSCEGDRGTRQSPPPAGPCSFYSR